MTPGCTLRDAIQAANDNASGPNGCNGDDGGGTGVDTILLQGGKTYKLTLHAAPEDSNASGDLDISGGGGTIIRSSGPGLATIDADSTIFPGPPDSNGGGRSTSSRGQAPSPSMGFAFRAGR